MTIQSSLYRWELIDKKDEQIIFLQLKDSVALAEFFLYAEEQVRI